MSFSRKSGLIFFTAALLFTEREAFAPPETATAPTTAQEHYAEARRDIESFADVVQGRLKQLKTFRSDPDKPFEVTGSTLDAFVKPFQGMPEAALEQLIKELPVGKRLELATVLRTLEKVDESPKTDLAVRDSWEQLHTLQRVATETVIAQAAANFKTDIYLRAVALRLDLMRPSEEAAYKAQLQQAMLIMTHGVHKPSALRGKPNINEQAPFLIDFLLREGDLLLGDPKKAAWFVSSFPKPSGERSSGLNDVLNAIQTSLQRGLVETDQALEKNLLTGYNRQKAIADQKERARVLDEEVLGRIMDYNGPGSAEYRIALERRLDLIHNHGLDPAPLFRALGRLSPEALANPEMVGKLNAAIEKAKDPASQKRLAKAADQLYEVLFHPSRPGGKTNTDDLVAAVAARLRFNAEGAYDRILEPLLDKDVKTRGTLLRKLVNTHGREMLATPRSARAAIGALNSAFRDVEMEEGGQLARLSVLRAVRQLLPHGHDYLEEQKLLTKGLNDAETRYRAASPAGAGWNCFWDRLRSHL